MSETVRWNKTDESYPPKKESSSLLDSEDSTDEYEGLSPIAMGLLQAGASMMRNSGWRNTPITMGEAVGNAIPAGLQGYYNQDAMNRQEEQGLYERQQAEQEALAAKQAEEDKARADAEIEEDRRLEFEASLEGSGLKSTMKTVYRTMYSRNPLKAIEALEKELVKKKETKAGPTHKYTTVTEADKIKKGLPKSVDRHVEPANGDVPFYVDNMGLRVDHAVVEDGGKISFVEDPNSGQVVITEGGKFKGQFTRPVEGEDATVEMIQGTYNALVKLDPENEPLYGEIMDTIESGTPLNKVHDTLYKKLAEFKGTDGPVVDSAAVAENMQNKLLEYLDTEGNLEVHAGKLATTMIIEPPAARLEAMIKLVEQIAPEVWKKDHSLRRTEYQKASLDQGADEFKIIQDNYLRNEKFENSRKVKKDNWGQSRLMMAKETHEIKMKQQKHNYGESLKPDHKYITASDWIKDNKGKLPAKVAMVSVRKDGSIIKMVNEDWTTYKEPLDNEAKGETTTAVETLLAKYPEKFAKDSVTGVDPKDIIRTLYHSKDPVDALKKAHAILQDKGVKGIQPPASILKKYAVDVTVRDAARTALDMLNTIPEVQKGTGMVWGKLVSEKLKPEAFNAYKAASTRASLAKRHALLGSQITEGELRFTESLFPSGGDNVKSARVKLEALLYDSEFNINLIHKMFSAEAGYNDAVWSAKAKTSPMSRDELMKKGG